MDYEDAYEEYLDREADEERPPDLAEGRALAEVRTFFEENAVKVFYSKQIEVRFERRYFHWITHRVLRLLADEGTIRLEQRKLATGTSINFVWHRSNRYVQRPLREVQRLVERYSDPDFTPALGNTGELLVSDGLGRFGFMQRGREASEYQGQRWPESKHNLDFLFERDGIAYGVEVKNTLSYIDDRELNVKLRICAHLGVRPLFVMRMAPATFIKRIQDDGGFALIIGYHLYPLSHLRFAREVREKLGLPADAPRALYDGTIQRFAAWHERQVGTGPIPRSNPEIRAVRRSARGPLRHAADPGREESGIEGTVEPGEGGENV